MQRKSKQQWLTLIEQFETSGLSQTDFCKNHDLNPKYFSLKRSKLLAPPETVQNPFVRAKLPADTMSVPALTLSYGCVKLQCNASESIASLAQLIKILA